METVASTISDSDSGPIGWVQSKGDIVEAVEQVFSYFKDRDAAEEKLLEDLWEWIEKLGELGGEPVEWAVKIGAAAAFAPFAAIGAGYMAAADQIKRDRSSIRFAEGLVMGVMAETPDNVRDYFWENGPDPDYDFAEAGQLAQYYANGGLAFGYAHGREVNAQGLGGGFWADVKKYLHQEFGDPANWDRNDWIDYYIATAAAFYRGHITD
jgi:hypothetical protein